ncbi:MAG: malate/lactate/ureidoglycolate dehydrogenase [Gammaproteobacteria bacterium]|nr:malate/lactate/ureidoglycolate dehydrogenase [Gammaproteobacteria bacterium]NIN37778.1 malate/lactate/ureidoglycolate dehydrogenase [Gammaproteobacteria bacterium]NIO23438.1 malate/lactate/ureidoglycolate dehydrogenase [Gammaproteobacteria bacterium]NIO64054.1 malate/lactate/ureidoglycolate dehydrogenase [Gammaproteobacteria bacterium]NIP47084.1 malate/lactate/ureidoglycolate dehydrogenase [Gammaproteobacteria bacterium]
MPLRGIVAEILRHGGSESSEADLVSRHLVDANLAGHDSHGVGMVPKYIEDLQADLVRPNTRAAIVKDDGALLIFDGGRGYGRPVAQEAMAAGLVRCAQTGIVLLALRRSHHLGRIGAYGEQSIAAGLVSIHFVNVTDHLPLVAPFGGRDARFSTNPICIAVPGTHSTEPLLLDMATSRIAFGKVKVAYNAGRQVPGGSLIDANGEPTDDPGAMFTEPRGALLPVGEHKGYGLALMCELLGGLLTGGGTMQPDNPRLGGILNHMLTVIIDPDRLVDRTWLAAELDAMIAFVKSSRPSSSDGSVLVAGDPERLMRDRRQREGIPINGTTWSEIVDAAAKVGIAREQVESMRA